jgi:hypothetical protein
MNCIIDPFVKENFTKMLNAFHILLENKYLIDRLYTYDEIDKVFCFQFYYKGNPKVIKIKNEKKFNFFDFLYQTYNRMFNINLNDERILFIKDFIDCLYDITGLPAITIEFKNMAKTNRLLLELKNLLQFNNNLICILVNEEEQDHSQFAYNILTTYELKEQIKFQEYKYHEEKSLNRDDPKNYTIKYTDIHNVLFKLRAFSEKSILNTHFSMRVLMDSENDIHFVNDLYPNDCVNMYSWIGINEMTSKFTKMIILENMKYEQQINGKFIKCQRKDNIVEYKSRWIYSFNINNDNTDVVIGLHQPSINYSTICSYLYAGIVVAKSNTPFITFVDYLPLKDSRQNFLKLKLAKGSYVVIPITSGFYFDNGEPNFSIEEINLFEKKMDPKKNKMLDDFSTEAKFIIDVGFIYIGNF